MDDEPDKENTATGAQQIAREFVIRARHNWFRRLVAWFKRHVLRWQVLDQSSLKEDS